MADAFTMAESRNAPWFRNDIKPAVGRKKRKSKNRRKQGRGGLEEKRQRKGER